MALRTPPQQHAPAHRAVPDPDARRGRVRRAAVPVLVAFAAAGLVGAASTSTAGRVDARAAAAERVGAAQAEALRVAELEQQRHEASQTWSRDVEDRAVRAAAMEAEAARLAEEARRAEAEEATRNALRDPRGAARVMIAEYGWDEEQFSCLDALWTKESGWDPRADNPSSSAYGIPQALPGSKMASAGEDWAENPVTQIRWGLGYVENRYGSPCSAWAHSRSHNWY